MKTNKQLQKKLTSAVEALFIDADVIKINRLLRLMLIDYLMFNKDGLPIDFNISLHHLSLLFTFLDKLQDANQEDST
jgi:hypothetical protein